MLPAYEAYFTFCDADKEAVLVLAGIILLIAVLQFVFNRIIKNNSASGKSVLLFKIFFNALAVMAFFICFEMTAYNVERRINDSFLPHTPYEMDLMLFWRPKSSLNNQRIGPFFVTTDNRSIRTNKEIPYEKEENEYRIMFIGDSWTFGMGLNDDQTYAYQLQKMLQKQYPHKKITSINAGCFSYCLAQGLIYFKYRGYKYKPDLVVIKNSFNRRIMHAYKQIYNLDYPKPIKYLRAVLWRSYGYHYLRRMRYLLTRTDYNLALSYGVQTASYETKVYNKIADEVRKSGASPLFLYLDFHSEDKMDFTMKSSAKQKSVPMVKLILNKSVEPEFHKINPGHPGPINAERIAEKLCRHIVNAGLVD